LLKDTALYRVLRESALYPPALEGLQPLARSLMAGRVKSLEQSLSTSPPVGKPSGLNAQGR